MIGTATPSNIARSFASGIPEVPREAQVYKILVSEKIGDDYHFTFSGPRWPVGVVYVGSSASCGPATIRALNLAFYCGMLRGERENELAHRGGSGDAA